MLSTLAPLAANMPSQVFWNYCLPCRFLHIVPATSCQPILLPPFIAKKSRCVLRSPYRTPTKSCLAYTCYVSYYTIKPFRIFIPAYTSLSPYEHWLRLHPILHLWDPTTYMSKKKMSLSYPPSAEAETVVIDQNRKSGTACTLLATTALAVLPLPKLGDCGWWWCVCGNLDEGRRIMSIYVPYPSDWASTLYFELLGTLGKGGA